LAVHIKDEKNNDKGDQYFNGLDRILPKMKGVIYQTRTSSKPKEVILSEAQDSDLLILGAGLTKGSTSFELGELSEYILNTSPCDVIVVKTQKENYDEVIHENESLSGYKAISLLVDKWFAENTYHAGEFDDLYHLISLKQKQKVTISLAMPALNE